MTISVSRKIILADIANLAEIACIADIAKLAILAEPSRLRIADKVSRAEPSRFSNGHLYLNVPTYLRVPSVRRGKRSPIGGNGRREGGGGPPLADAALDVPELPAERHDAVVRHIGDVGRRAHGRGAKVPPVTAYFSTRVGCALIAFLDFKSSHSATCKDAGIKSVFLIKDHFEGFHFRVNSDIPAVKGGGAAVAAGISVDGGRSRAPAHRGGRRHRDQVLVVGHLKRKGYPFSRSAFHVPSLSSTQRC